jgi:hypothetical protein
VAQTDQDTLRQAGVEVEQQGLAPTGLQRHPGTPGVRIGQRTTQNVGNFLRQVRLDTGGAR